MIAYHGSNHNFKQFKIGKELVERGSTLKNEGLGIYFSTDKEVAMSYGKYLYTLNINDDYFFDFTQKEVCKNYLKSILAKVEEQTNVDISEYLDLDSVVTYMHCGGIAIAGVGNEIKECLDNDETFYFAYSQTKRNKVYNALKQIDKSIDFAYQFTYHIKDVGVIKSISSNVVQIVDKQQSCDILQEIPKNKVIDEEER